MEKVSVFISYSHEDETYKDKLEKHLSILKRNEIIETWHDRKIVPGEEWDKIIKQELESAQIILLLVSVDFLNSDYCYDVEIKRAVERHNSGEAVLIPIILRKCDWKDTSFSKIQALPKNADPVKSFNDEDEAFYSITEGIKSSISKLREKEKIKYTLANPNKIKNVEISYQIKNECDTPPSVLHWVGRQKEIDEIDLDLHKVVFISGLGGQGKSGLASHYVREVALKNGVWEFWDWRDCQEKENRIHTKIISIIVRITEGRILANQISEATIDELIELLFQELGSRKIVFVFDNIDAYIEFENFHLIGAVDKLYKAALKRNHNSKFIFTCRSSINDVDPELLSIKLLGLSLEETKVLFDNYKLPYKSDDVQRLSEKSFHLSKGHPLWLNLIIAQARRGLEIAESFIKDVAGHSTFQEDSLSSLLSNKILNAIWMTLNDKQKTLLLAFAEIVRAETEENLSKILNSELKYNQFSKAFSAIKKLNLVVVKSKFDEHDTFELHPLVKEYIIHNYGRIERAKFISLFVNFYDSVILVLKSKLNSNQPLIFFENWTVKIELAINKDDYKTALVSLEEVSCPICEAGYIEEYIRIASLLFINIDWKIAISEEYSYFNSQFTKFVETLTDFGKFDDALAFLTKYEKHITNKGVDYIRFCKVKGHLFWSKGLFEDAIELVREGVNLEEQSVTNSGLDLKHTLALSLRDTRKTENISKALDIFLHENTVEELLTGDNEFIAGETYGNVGRCLHLGGKIEDALICYKKSINSLQDPMNKGYAYFWYAESLVADNKIDNAIWFYRQAYFIWKIHSPIKAMDIQKKINAIIEINPSLESIKERSEKDIEQFCSSIINDQ
uniref:toll/interleukin-1 receptor domain-containing protein n=1 Tax=uncultured Dysgonomonas sp. TaxID=206096 RepID=UPI002584ADB8|nr:toll/interleukin-1 receptor domain-containing protein [uncultured Dysgonomonas sp.]